ncbi:MAG: hypothetical protein U0936_25260 [Planctomycetaceae bacterium]
MPAAAKGDASEFAKDEITEFELTVPESIVESDAKEAGENAQQVEEQAQANLAEKRLGSLHGSSVEMDTIGRPATTGGIGRRRRSNEKQF